MKPSHRHWKYYSKWLPLLSGSYLKAVWSVLTLDLILTKQKVLRKPIKINSFFEISMFTCLAWNNHKYIITFVLFHAPGLYVYCTYLITCMLVFVKRTADVSWLFLPWVKCETWASSMYVTVACGGCFLKVWNENGSSAYVLTPERNFQKKWGCLKDHVTWQSINEEVDCEKWSSGFCACCQMVQKQDWEA